MTFDVEWTSEAWTELRALPVSERRPLMRAVAALAKEAEQETPRRRLLPDRSGELPDATFELEVGAGGGDRLLYRLADPARADGRRSVQILRVVIERRAGAPRPSTLTRVEARELRRRAEILRRIGGGVPHEVVCRLWLIELRRERGQTGG